MSLMADNDTFRYLGGSRLANLFSVHVRMGVYDLVLSGPRLVDLEPSWVIVGRFLALFRCSNETSKIVKNIHKTYGFRNMRVQDEPKMAPKSAPFFTHKIVRILRKTQGPGHQAST